MLTTDPIFKKPLLPVITIKNIANTTTLYTYSSFTGAATVKTSVFPIYCSVNLSASTHGEFVIQFEDSSKVMESTITVNSRVQIDCGKQSTSLIRLISGLIRKKGYSRGANGKILYTITGSSTAIRLNELLRYVVSEAAKTADGVTPDKTDASRKADVLLANNLSGLIPDSIVSIANLAANSDVETFIANLSIEYGQLQDLVNYIEQQSGGQVVVDTNDLVNFRYEIKNNLTGRGFTIKNSRANEGADDADDTMYLIGKNWSYEDDFYTPNYANKITAIMRAESRPSQPLDLGFVSINSFTVTNGVEFAVKFKPPHTRFTPGDIYVVISQWSNGIADLLPYPVTLKICRDAAGVPQNTGGIVAYFVIFPTVFQDPLPVAYAIETSTLTNDGYFFAVESGEAGDFYLDTTRNYWLIFGNDGGTFPPNVRYSIGRNMNATVNPGILTHTSGFGSSGNGGTGWVAAAAGNNLLPCFGVARYRSTPYTMWDPKGAQALTNRYIESMATETAIQITTRDSMVRHLAEQLYQKARPQTSYNFPTVMAPNIPPFPGDPIVISDSILGLSTTGNQVVLTTCGDMTYQWGNMGSGGYDAPTKLNINAIGVHSRYV